MRALSRRTFLRGFAGSAAVTVGLPVLDAMLNGHGTAFAQGQPFPRRFGIWFFGNGVQLNRWLVRPAAGQEPPALRTGWWNYLSTENGPNTSSLGVLNVPGLRESISIISGTQCRVNTGSVHNEGRCAVMTGSFDRAIGQFGAPTLPSADQLMADEFGALTPFRSLEVGVSDTAPQHQLQPNARRDLHARRNLSAHGEGPARALRPTLLTFHRAERRSRREAAQRGERGEGRRVPAAAAAGRG